MRRGGIASSDAAAIASMSPSGNASRMIVVYELAWVNAIASTTPSRLAMMSVRRGPSRSIGTPRSGPSNAPGTESTTKSSAMSAGPASNLNAAKPQIAMTATQLPVALIACPASSRPNPRTRNTRNRRMPRR